MCFIIRLQFQRYLLANFIEESTLLDLGLELYNHTQSSVYVNPVDVATVIDLLEMLVNTQAQVIVLKVTQWTDARRTYARAKENFPMLEETEEFMNVSKPNRHTTLNQH